jgi:acetolactate synthase regulatory subunit
VYVPGIPTGQVISPNATINVTPTLTTSDLIIEKYNSNVTAARGASRMETVTVRSAGKSELKNVTLFLTGIPLEWYNVTPSKYAFLKEGESTIFIVTFNIPKTAETITYNATLHASAGTAADARNITITVFSSMEELLQNEIKRVKDKLVEFLVDMGSAEREGRDTSSPAMLVEDINALISAADESFGTGDYATSMKKIQEAEVLLDRAIEMLASAPLRPRAEFPLMLMLLAAIILAAAIILYVYFRRRRHAVRPYVSIVGRLLESIRSRPRSKRELMEQHEKLVDVLSALEKEKNEGIISLGTYRSMKREFESKLDKVRKDIE